MSAHGSETVTPLRFSNALCLVSAGVEVTESRSWFGPVRPDATKHDV